MADTATRIMDRELELAEKLRFADHRARQLVDMAVSYALMSRREPDEHDFMRFAHDVALDACACLIRQLYENDGEMNALRAERDEYKARALEFASVTPTRFVIQTVANTASGDTHPEGGDAKQGSVHG